MGHEALTALLMKIGLLLSYDVVLIGNLLPAFRNRLQPTFKETVILKNELL